MSVAGVLQRLLPFISHLAMRRSRHTDQLQAAKLTPPLGTLGASICFFYWPLRELTPQGSAHHQGLQGGRVEVGFGMGGALAVGMAFCTDISEALGSHYMTCEALVKHLLVPDGTSADCLWNLCWLLVELSKVPGGISNEYRRVLGCSLVESLIVPCGTSCVKIKVLLAVAQV